VNSLFECLKRNQRRGSKPRCHLLTNGDRTMIAGQLSRLIEPFGRVSADDKWMPQGFEVVDEAQLHNAPYLLSVEVYGQALASWWLAHTKSHSVTPNWDIASTCSIDGKRGLLLVEAKAHYSELQANDRCGATNTRNLERIGVAIGEANKALNSIQTGWNLSHENHYQLCNRFAWSWKLATLGIPVVLVYLGFLNADEMQNPFLDAQSWDSAVRHYARDFVPESVWDSLLMIDDTPVYPLIRSMCTSLVGRNPRNF